jgi:hypothetical protein
LSEDTSVSWCTTKNELIELIWAAFGVKGCQKKSKKGAIEYLEAAAGAEADCAADTIATMVLKARICLANIFGKEAVREGRKKK